MRTFGITALLISVFALFCAIPSGSARAGASQDFASWALDRSSECDARWGRITGLNYALAARGVSDETLPRREFPALAARVIHGTKLEHDIISMRSFIRTVDSRTEFIPLSTRDRNGASRGLGALQSPAKARLAMPYDIRRPFGSVMQHKDFFPDRGTSIVRPKLNSFGRIAKTEQHRSRSAVRPAYRCARPRIL